MNRSTCCPCAAQPTTTATVARFFRAFAGWIVPSAVLALMPKCPICVAAYVALFTGIGLSLTAAAYVRWGLIGLSLAALGYVALRSIRRWVLGRSVSASRNLASFNPQPTAQAGRA